jgi:hypothetical protein
MWEFIIMKISKGLSPVTRAIGVFSAVAIIAGGATYAALTSTATLTENTISSANSSLLIYNGTDFAATAKGFDFTGLIPGQGSDAKPFYLKNAGDSALKVTAHVPTAPEAPQGGYDFTGWENLKVTFKSLETGCSANTVNTTMAALLAGEVELPCNAFSLGAQGNNTPDSEATEGNYSVKVDIDPASVKGSSPAVGKFNFVFTGTAVAPNYTNPQQ